jgi:Ca2+-binding RTX toxin-like protein
MTQNPSPSLPACIDRLESRLLLAGVSLSDGTLLIDGSNRDDTVLMRLDIYFPDLQPHGDWVVVLNGQRTVWTRGLVDRVVVSLGNGNDSFRYGDPDDNGELTTVYGGNGNDTIMGSYRTDVIYGGNGNDVIEGWAGDDTIHGGNGRDTIAMSQGTPKVLGYIFGDGGDDTITARRRVIIYGGAGNDLIHTSGSTVYGGAGNDTIIGDYSDDLIYGGPGNDSISGVGGHDTLFGQAGRDTLVGGFGSSQLLGGPGRDLLTSRPGVPDTLNGGPSHDTLLGQPGEDVLIQ